MGERMSRFEQERLHLKMQAILVRFGVLSTRKQAKTCTKCRKVYEKFDALLGRSA